MKFTVAFVNDSQHLCAKQVTSILVAKIKKLPGAARSRRLPLSPQIAMLSADTERTAAGTCFGFVGDYSLYKYSEVLSDIDRSTG
ncbi:MAG: hypothetical protein HY290_23645 [Planctomycetia bacterium]|nr:hypothetical protein [Planctomycetia bacterium]